MKRWIKRCKTGLSKWMQGRYGIDELSRFLMIVSLILFVLSCFRGLRWCYLAALILMIGSVLRCYSRNLEKRRLERDSYLRATERIRGRRNVQKQRWGDRKTHRYLTCKQCRATLRVPKGKGTLQITCPKCGNTFQKKV